MTWDERDPDKPPTKPSQLVYAEMAAEANDDAERSATMLVMTFMAAQGAVFGFGLCGLLSWLGVIRWG